MGNKNILQLDIVYRDHLISVRNMRCQVEKDSSFQVATLSVSLSLSMNSIIQVLYKPLRLISSSPQSQTLFLTAFLASSYTPQTFFQSYYDPSLHSKWPVLR